MHSKISVMHTHEKTQSDPQIKEYLEITASDWFLAQNELTQSPPQSDHQRLPSTGLDVPFWKEGECVDQLIQTAGCMYQTVPTGLHSSPPVGPAIPVVEMPQSDPKFFTTPKAICSAIS